MNCSKCGAPLQDGATSCVNCGAKVVNGSTGAPAASASVNAPANMASKEVVQEGCLKAAWRDIKATPNWFRKIFLLCVVGWIPVLSFGVTGYALNWSKEIFYGKRNTLPSKIFRKGEIVEGFKAFVVMLGITLALTIVVVLVLAILGAIIGIFSAVGAATVIAVISFIITLIVVIYFGPFAYIAQLRMSIVGHLEAGFNFKDIWKVYGKNKASGVFIFFMPILIMCLIIFVLSLILGGLVAACAATAVTGLSSSLDALNSMQNMGSAGMYGLGNSGFYNTTPSTNLAHTLLSGGSAITLVFILFTILMCIIGVFFEILLFRAYGHYCARHAQEWVNVKNDDEGYGFAESKNNATYSNIPNNPTNPSAQASAAYATSDSTAQVSTPSASTATSATQASAPSAPVNSPAAQAPMPSAVSSKLASQASSPASPSQTSASGKQGYANSTVGGVTSTDSPIIFNK